MWRVLVVAGVLAITCVRASAPAESTDLLATENTIEDMVHSQVVAYWCGKRTKEWALTVQRHARKFASSQVRLFVYALYLSNEEAEGYAEGLAAGDLETSVEEMSLDGDRVCAWVEAHPGWKGFLAHADHYLDY